MAEKKTAHKVGDVVSAKTVIDTDGHVIEVTGGAYVLMVPGSYVIDGHEVTAS